MKLENKKIGVALTGSFCTYEKVFPQIENLVKEGAHVTTIFSFNSQKIDSRFGKALDHIARARILTGNEPIFTIEDAEPLGPKNLLDILLIAPCTGNTTAKLANAITDTPVLMAAKGHLRNDKPVVLAIATNDGLTNSLKNIGHLLNTKNIYMVPFGQDDYKKKPNSLVAQMDLIVPTLESALEGNQFQPLTLPPK
ncbi:dipicolinate synthase subunit B [Anaeromicropila herbilytica]|uniref:Dipicolinate synthase subunit B n=1 Tax=Anaeromicropila herbilytica TaxID=2785025 RepID=A0A7R7EKK4_9FIRM|nr:dipicolinate synthase subunit B [Anaeromicropila herbilytica]BCN30596.1 dipicolinate synthase subunit B [Anaeromicropila herbilytica]